MPEGGRALKAEITKGLKDGSKEVIVRYFKGDVPKQVETLREKFLKNQLGYLAQYVKDVYKNKVDILPSRSQMYANALHSFEAELLAYKAKTKGAEWERRILGHEDHACPECVALSKKGWRRYGTLPMIGETVCKTNCKCKFDYSYTTAKPPKEKT